MREVLEAAERLAKEQKKNRRKREETDEETAINSSRDIESNGCNESQLDHSCSSDRTQQNSTLSSDTQDTEKEKDMSSDKESTNEGKMQEVPDKSVTDTNDAKPVQVPISKEVAIVLSGRLEDTELLNKANLQLVNLVLTPTPRTLENSSSNLLAGLNSLVHGMGNARIPSTIVENRLLTPSKYRATNGRDFGTQTDVENDLQDSREDLRDIAMKNVTMKDCKDATNASKRDIEK